MLPFTTFLSKNRLHYFADQLQSKALIHLLTLSVLDKLGHMSYIYHLCESWKR